MGIKSLIDMEARKRMVVDVKDLQQMPT